ncbi:nuclear transport factor 2 family protein [Amycolatopsis nigrescens]|uniref:nuclear transport factor 2 family protein n=1 Tax=Amycolatopsis nigrescens TaxID=381445 RepID=UPI00037609EC|nr:nuclear transport factor 2 family protein [Amycolatopsis nigrescens]
MTGTTDARELVSTLFDRMTEGDLDGMAELLHPEFVSHNPRVAHDPAVTTGKRAFVDFFRSEAGQRLLAAPFEIRRVLVDGDLVAVHNRISPPGGPEIAAVDLLAVRDGLVVEHWDVVQPVPDPLPHPHGMF